MADFDLVAPGMARKLRHEIRGSLLELRGLYLRCVHNACCSGAVREKVQLQSTGAPTVPTQKYLPAEISRPTHHFIHHHTFYYYKIKINGLFVRPVAKYSQIAGLKAEILLN